MFKSFVPVVLALALVGCADDMVILDRLIGMKPGAEKPEAVLPPENPATDDLQGQFDMAEFYLEQEQIVTAMAWYSKCANSGYQPCIRELGYGYIQGAGVSYDPFLGMQLLQYAMDDTDPEMLNDIAWFLATHKETALRDPNKAMELMEIHQQHSQLDAMSTDTLAAVYAANGLFQQAAKVQQKALNMLLREGGIGNDVLVSYRERLQMYRNDTPYTE
ncbi:hypothetical protein [Echinimonas agarilytica]|uniref:Sel1 repeat family protein n=1 Tax=Echinimonas agarilytica TaxID=1215918 RepID=A0AA42B6T0_9GAMM|nr:hypothetical protein [Echinimonas agarilytica]MCM2678851.1 hypothetical protein [Echinimonas agarilytica]